MSNREQNEGHRQDKSQVAATLRIAVDIGGTFTDLAAFDERGDTLSFGKALSTHDDLVRGIQDTVNGACVNFKDAFLFLHGSTIVINTLLERTGAETALLITEGFRDIYEIGRINRPDAYNLFFDKHSPLVPRSLRFEIPERLLASGETYRPLDEDAVRKLAKSLQVRGIEAVAILLLHSYRNPDHEKRVKEIFQEYLPSAFVSASHELTQEYREFERASTVAANAYVGPRVESYLGDLERHIERAGFPGDFYAVQSTGGLFPVEDARRDCVRMLESGPAAGVIGTQAICAQIGLSNAIAFDMGGTTAKAGVILDGQPLTTGSALIGSYERALPIQIPMIDIFEVGTGGGSIAYVDDDGGLRVGPRSAGSNPGPVCYGRGGENPTVTDANLLLGRLDPEHFLGGQMRLDVKSVKEAIEKKISQPLNLDTVQAAEGILRIAATAMSYAVKGVTTERGLDAGSFAMVVYGGAGPLHAAAIAREIGIKRVIIPFSPGHFSAYGMLFGDLRYDYVRSCFQKIQETPFELLENWYQELEMEGRRAIGDSAIRPEGILISRFADMRYVGQEHAVTVELPLAIFKKQDREAIKHAFDLVHLQRYGTSAPNEPAEIVSIRATVIGSMRKPPRQALKNGDDKPTQQALSRIKPVCFQDAGFVETPVYDRLKLLSGNQIIGPALIEEHASTTVLWPGDFMVVDGFGNLDITIGENV